MARRIAGHVAVHFDEDVEIIRAVLESDRSLRSDLVSDRTAYYDRAVVVIINPHVTYGGTAYPGSLDDFVALR